MTVLLDLNFWLDFKDAKKFIQLRDIIRNDSRPTQAAWPSLMAMS